MVTKFEDLEIWQKGLKLVLQMYESFKVCKDFAFKDHIQRAAVSIPSNIAEGFERQTNREFIPFCLLQKKSSANCKRSYIWPRCWAI